MSDLEIIRKVIATLDGISVPVSMLEQIGVPLYNASGELKNLYTTVVKRIEEAKKQQEAAANEPEVTLEKVDEIPEDAEFVTPAD